MLSKKLNMCKTRERTFEERLGALRSHFVLTEQVLHIEKRGQIRGHAVEAAAVKDLDVVPFRKAMVRLNALPHKLWLGCDVAVVRACLYARLHIARAICSVWQRVVVYMCASQPQQLLQPGRLPVCALHRNLQQRRQPCGHSSKSP